MKSLKRNFSFNILLNISSVIFPLITAPYVARILQPDGVGLYNFANTFASYFSLVALLGIPNYGIREVSKLRDNKKGLQLFVSQILSISVITTLLVSVLYFSLIIILKQLNENFTIFFVAGFLVYLSPFKIDWFYKGLEEFEYITIRTLVIRVVSIICLFVFVREKNDLIIYIILTVLGVAGADVWNFYKLWLSGIHPFFTTTGIGAHFKPLCILFASSIAISVYTVLDTIMLGFITDYSEVGYYNNAIHVAKVLLALVTSFSAVSIPRFAYYVKEKNLTKANELFNRSLSLVSLFSFPLAFIIMCVAPVFVPWFFGASFTGAIVPLMILGFLNIAIGVSNITGLQVMIGIGMDKLFLKSILVGTIINFSLNLILIPYWGAIGASVASVVAEFSVTITMLIFIYKYSFVRVNLLSDSFKSLFGAFLFIPLVTIIPANISAPIYLVIYGVSCATIYVISQRVLKNSSYLLIRNIVITRMKNFAISTDKTNSD